MKGVLKQSQPSLLWWSVYRNLPDLVDYLMTVDGFMVKEAAPDGTTPLLLALAKKQVECIEVLRSHIGSEEMIKQQLCLGIDPEQPIPDDLMDDAFHSEDQDFVERVDMDELAKKNLVTRLQDYWQTTDDTLMKMSSKYPYVNEPAGAESETIMKFKRDEQRTREKDGRGQEYLDFEQLFIATRHFCPIQDQRKTALSDLSADASCNPDCQK